MPPRDRARTLVHRAGPVVRCGPRCADVGPGSRRRPRSALRAPRARGRAAWALEGLEAHGDAETAEDAAHGGAAEPGGPGELRRDHRRALPGVAPTCVATYATSWRVGASEHDLRTQRPPVFVRVLPGGGPCERFEPERSSGLVSIGGLVRPFEGEHAPSPPRVPTSSSDDRAGPQRERSGEFVRTCRAGRRCRCRPRARRSPWWGRRAWPWGPSRGGRPLP